MVHGGRQKPDRGDMVGDW